MIKDKSGKLYAELKALPDLPGVYIMKNSIDSIIYIGKAINLKRRVKSYFQGGTKSNRKLERLVTEVAALEYILTDTELEALILECGLIKKHRPHFNAALKNDQKYPYIKITNDTYPYLSVSISKEAIGSTGHESARYYGPFKGSDNSLRQVIGVLNQIWALRSCDSMLNSNRVKSPCINYHLKKCSAPCAGYISQKEYLRGVNKAEKFLRGRHRETLRYKKKEMEHASESLLFEQAALRRDELNILRMFAYRHKIMLGSLLDRDMMIFTPGLAEASKNSVIIYLIRFGKMLAKAVLTQEQLKSDESKAYIDGFLRANHPNRLSQLNYLNHPNHLDCDDHRSNYTRGEIDEILIIQGWLKHGKQKKAFIEIDGSERGQINTIAANALDLARNLAQI